MPSRKRSASQALLPTRTLKQARMTVDRSDTEAGVNSSPSYAHGLLAKWIVLGKETLKYFLGGYNEMQQLSDLPNTFFPTGASVKPSTRHPFSSEQDHSHPISGTSQHPPPQRFTFNRSSLETPATSRVNTPASTSNHRDMSPYDQLQIALSKHKIRSRSANGVNRNYRRKEHIHAKLHKSRVRAELEKKLYELQRAKGYSSDFETFRGYLEYLQRLQDLKAKESPSPSSLGNHQAILEPTDDLFFERAIQKARKTFESPRPPKPFVPTIEQLRISTRAKDEAIDRRLRPKRAPLPDRLSHDAQKEVDKLLSRQGIISKCAKEQVTDRDLLRLRPHQWLNDEIINFYGQLILSRSMEADAAKENGRRVLDVHYFSTFFWAKLKSGYDKGRLAKWTKKLDIFSKDVILIPVNHNNSHWSAAAINFRRKRIESYDSMGLDRGEVYRALRMYLDEEHKNKKKKPFDFQGWEDHIVEDIPQQENCYDCGVFTCQFLESLSRGEETFNFSQRDMSYLRQRMIWEIGRVRLHDVV